MQGNEHRGTGGSPIPTSCLGPSAPQVPRDCFWGASGAVGRFFFFFSFCRRLSGFLTLSGLGFFSPLAESEVHSRPPLLPRTVRGSGSAALSGARVPPGLGTGAGIQSAKSRWVEGASRVGEPGAGSPLRSVAAKRRGISRGAEMLRRREMEATGQAVSGLFLLMPVIHGPDFNCYFFPSFPPPPPTSMSISSTMGGGWR